MTSGKLRRLTDARIVLPTCTYPWTHIVGGLYISWWGIGSSLRSVLSSCYFVDSYKLVLHTLVNYVHPYVIWVHKTTSCAFANYAHVFILQTIILSLYLYLANSHLANCTLSILQIVIYFLSNCHLANCTLSILQTVILQTVPSFFSIRPWNTISLLVVWGWTWGAFLWSRLISMTFLLMGWVEILLSLIIFFCMFPRVLFLTLCVATGCMESFGKCSFCFGP